MSASGGPRRAALPISPALIDYGLLATLAAIWGGAFLLVKLAVADIPPVSVAAGRIAIAAVLLLGAALMSRRALPRRPQAWALILAVALAGNVAPFTLIAWGQETVDAGLAAIVMGIGPLATAALAHLFTTDEKAGPLKLLGLALGLAGVVVLIGPAKLLGLTQETLRYLAIAGAACGYAVASLFNKRLMAQESFRGVSAGVMIVSAAILIPASLALDRPWELAVSDRALAALILLGIFPTALANLMLLAIIRRRGATFFSQINYLVPLSGLAWGILVLAEEPPPQAFAALALILAGVAVAARGGRRPAPPTDQTG